MNVGNGSHTWVWKDKGVPRLVGFQVASTRPINVKPYWVSNLIDLNCGMWKLGLLRSLFTPQEVDAISMVPISSEGIEDRWVWHYTKNGQYSIHSGYMFLSEEFLQLLDSTNRVVNWKWIWKLPLPLKLQAFIWICFRGILLTPLNLSQRNCSSSSYCPDSYNVEETINHVML